jgi:hypothetical protein
MKRHCLGALVAAAAIVTACTGEGRGEERPNSGQSPWGPLAVVHDPSTLSILVSGGQGSLEISDDCVSLGDMTLVWRDRRISWDGEKGQIVVDTGKGTIRLRDGDTISIGGLGGTSRHVRVGGEVFIKTSDGRLARPDWLSPPDDSCPPVLWFVHRVSLIGNSGREEEAIGDAGECIR